MKVSNFFLESNRDHSYNLQTEETPIPLLSGLIKSSLRGQILHQNKLLIPALFRPRQERITTTKKGSITSVQAIYVPADDLTDPAPATTFAHLDATTVLSRAIAELGIYPAVDPLDSTSRIMDPNIIGSEHYSVARGVQKILQDYKSLQDIIAILGES